MKGRFVVLEGIDGSGKTTLARRLADAVGNAVVTSEPTDGVVGRMLRSGELGNIPPAAEALLFAADRAVHTRSIKKRLDSGTWVVCDRYLASTVAYQAASMGDAADIEWLVGMQKHSVIEPDAVFLLDIDPEESMARVESRGEEKSRFEKLGFLRRVRTEYLKLADRFGYTVIDASASPEEVFREAVDALRQKGLYASERRDLL